MYRSVKMELFTALLATFMVLVVMTYLSKKKPSTYPPGPIKWPLVGTLPAQLMSRTLGIGYWEWGLKYGKIYSIQLGQLDVIVLTDFDLAKEANAKEELVDRPQFDFWHFFMKYKNAGLIFANGQDWKVRRRFTLKHLRDFGFGKSSMEQLILDEMRHLADSINTEKNPKGSIVELDSGLNAAVGNVIWWLTANRRVDGKDTEMKNILETIDSLSHFDLTNIISLIPALKPFFPDFMLNHEKRLKRRTRVYDYMQGLIDEHRRTVDPTEPRDLIDCCIIEQQRLRESGEDDSCFEGKCQKSLLNDKLAWTLADLFIAGAETTATTLRWTILYLISYPEVQVKLHQEIDKGTIVTTALYAIHHDPKNFKNPEIFYPERFLGEDGNLIKNPKIMPFQAGKRQCLGETLARMNAFLGLVYLLQTFKFEKVPGFHYTLEPKKREEVVHIVQFGQHDIVVLTDFDLAKEANAREELVDRPQFDFYHFFMKYKNSGLIFANGQDWKVRRRFTLKHLRAFGFGKSSMEQLILDEMQHLVDSINVSNGDTSRTLGIHWDQAQPQRRVESKDTELKYVLETFDCLCHFDMANILSFIPSLKPFVPGFLLNHEKRLKRRTKVYNYMQGLIDEHRHTVDPTEPRDLIDCCIIEQQKLRKSGEDDSYFEGKCQKSLMTSLNHLWKS
ncbi:unnamed protein product [Notodromas monacha]|uniref:Cytochrome P450 n=1 Tax=Notodromas monacha TaxID=399045 RepID=A0A7R9GGE8_9CRUS|nr:unnamed protein product [Notodromas monacha]CAG0919871.1 unnamed protein product [Notodromas monacha]